MKTENTSHTPNESSSNLAKIIEAVYSFFLWFVNTFQMGFSYIYNLVANFFSTTRPSKAESDSEEERLVTTAAINPSASNVSNQLFIQGPNTSNSMPVLALKTLLSFQADRLDHQPLPILVFLVFPKGLNNMNAGFFSSLLRRCNHYSVQNHHEQQLVLNERLSIDNDTDSSALTLVNQAVCSQSARRQPCSTRVLLLTFDEKTAQFSVLNDSISEGYTLPPIGAIVLITEEQIIIQTHPALTLTNGAEDQTWRDVIPRSKVEGPQTLTDVAEDQTWRDVIPRSKFQKTPITTKSSFFVQVTNSVYDTFSPYFSF